MCIKQTLPYIQGYIHVDICMSIMCTYVDTYTNVCLCLII